MLDHIICFFESDKYLLETILKVHIPSIFIRIIRKCGQLYIIKQYFNNFIIHNQLKDSDLISECAKYNQFEMMKYFHEKQIGSKYGNLEKIKRLHHNRAEGCSKTMDNASMNGHFEIIKWLHENRSEGCTTDAMDYAAENGHLETLKWLHENRSEGCTTDAMNNATKKGLLKTIYWISLNRTEVDINYKKAYLKKDKVLNQNVNNRSISHPTGNVVNNEFNIDFLFNDISRIL